MITLNKIKKNHNRDKMKLIFQDCAKSQSIKGYPFQFMVDFPTNDIGWRLAARTHKSIDAWTQHAQLLALDNGWDITYYIHDTHPTKKCAGSVDFFFRREIEKMRFQLLIDENTMVRHTHKVTAVTPEELDTKEQFLRRFLAQQDLSDEVLIYRASDTQFSVTTTSLRHQLWVRQQLNMALLNNGPTPLTQVPVAPVVDTSCLNFEGLLQEQGLHVHKLG